MNPRPAAAPSTELRRTKRGWRLSQHGTVLSEILTRPGPTHSVFDLLAAAASLHPAPRHIAILGFGGGGTLAALRALGIRSCVHGVDLDRRGFDLLTTHSGDPWEHPLHWAQADAVHWLRTSRRRFDVIIEDLSLPVADEVEKPEVTWTMLPTLVRSRLAADGIAVFNLLPPIVRRWQWGMDSVRAPFRQALRVDLRDFHNRIVLAIDRELPTRRAAAQIRRSLEKLGSRMVGRFDVRNLSPGPASSAAPLNPPGTKTSG